MLHFYIRSSFLNSFAHSSYWGVNAYYRELYRIKYSNRYMAHGTNVHQELGMNNRESREVDILLKPNILITLEGTPDNLEPLIELKTTNQEKAGEKIIKGATYQLYAYMFLFDRPEGYVVVVNRDSYRELTKVKVTRNDEMLYWILEQFVNTVLERKSLPSFAPYR